MTKGVPSQPRACMRCGQPYQPAIGPQRYYVQCRPIMHKVYARSGAEGILSDGNRLTKG